VAEVRELDDIAEVYLEPVGRRMPQRAAQFVYVSFEAEAVSRELHPYTVSSAPEADTLRLSVKELGDWSRKMMDLKPGDQARVWGPYGEFGNHLWQQPERDAVLIAGGIGITPFLSMLASDAFMQRRQGKTYLVYSVNKADEAAYHEEIEELDLDGLDIIHVPHHSDDEGLLDARMLREMVGDLPAKCFLICGPAPLMNSVKEELLKADVPLERIFKEDFNLI
jgi:predicted ferric reductase